MNTLEILLPASAARARRRFNKVTAMYGLVHEDYDLKLQQSYLTMEAE